MLPPDGSDLLPQYVGGGRTWLDAATVTLRNVDRTVDVRLVRGVKVSGSVRWTYSTGRVRATVVTRTGGTVERLRMAWSLQVRAARGRIVGSEGGRTLRLHMLAP